MNINVLPDDITKSYHEKFPVMSEDVFMFYQRMFLYPVSRCDHVLSEDICISCQRMFLSPFRRSVNLFMFCQKSFHVLSENGSVSFKQICSGSVRCFHVLT